MAGGSGTTVSLEERARRRNCCLEGRVEGTDRLGLPLGGSGDTSEQGAGWHKVEERAGRARARGGRRRTGCGRRGEGDGGGAVKEEFSARTEERRHLHTREPSGLWDFLEWFQSKYGVNIHYWEPPCSSSPPTNHVYNANGAAPSSPALQSNRLLLCTAVVESLTILFETV
jgi:hypothetical protein